MKDEKSLIPKKVTILDRIKKVLRQAVGYREGKRFILDTEPKLRKYTDIELMKLARLEEKLKNVINQNQNSQYLVAGIEETEAELLLEWVVQNAREGLENGKDVAEIKDDGLLGACGLGQGITGFSLQNMGLLPNISNAYKTFSEFGRHAFLTVGIPIKNSKGEIQNKLYLVDTTFRQFFLRDEWNIIDREFIKDKRFGNKVAPIEGYWAMQVPHGAEFSEKLLANGYIELTEQNAKVYGDAFTLAAKPRKDYTKVPKGKELITGIDGKTYIERMLDPKLQQEIDYDPGELDNYWKINTKTPAMRKSEIVTTLKDIEDRGKSAEHTEIAYSEYEQ